MDHCQVQISKDIKQNSPKIVLGLNGRQLLCVIIAIAFSLIVYNVFKCICFENKTSESLSETVEVNKIETSENSQLFKIINKQVDDYYYKTGEGVVVNIEQEDSSNDETAEEETPKDDESKNTFQSLFFFLLFLINTPIMLIGFYKPNGIYFEEYIKTFIISYFFSPSKRVYKTENAFEKIINMSDIISEDDKDKKNKTKQKKSKYKKSKLAIR